MAAPPEAPQPATSVQIPVSRRPTGLTLLSILWVVFGFYNLYIGLVSLVSDINALPLLSTPQSTLNSTQVAILNWLQYGLPADTVIQGLVTLVGVLQIVMAIGFMTARRWSYRGALIPIVLVPISWAAQAVLYSTAPSVLGLFSSSLASGAVGSLLWIYFYLAYLKKPYVKEYLGVSEPSTPSGAPPPAT